MTDLPGNTRVWINVTTSANWTRPAVGIVRVERALAEHLQDQLGPDRCRLCVWKDGRFVEWLPGEEPADADGAHALDVLLPHGSSFDLSRSFLSRALRKFGDGARPAGRRELRMDIPLDDANLPQPTCGDILISVGLDWDNQYSSRFYAIARSQGLRIVTCCYDLIPVLFPQYCVGDVAKRFAEYFMDLTWGSEAVLCISRHTQRDYQALCADLCAPKRRTVVIPLGDNLPSGSPDIGAVVQEIARKPFILFVSTIERRKNHEVLYRAYHLLARRGLAAELPTLVFVGMPGWGIGDLLKDIELDPVTQGKIVQLHHVSDGELEFLYTKARFCVYPSLYEGWGLPVGEALSMGKAVISSGEASLPEVGADLVRYVSPWDPYAWADAIHDYVSNPALVPAAEARVRAEYVPRNWADTAAAVVALLGEMIAQSDGSTQVREFVAGYDMSTACGVHWGSGIRTTGTGGVLMFGPHISMRRGTYRVQVVGEVGPDHRGRCTMEVTSDAARSALVVGHYDLLEPGSGVLADFEVDIPRFAQGVEVRCIVDPSCNLRLDAVRISPAEHAPPAP